MLPLLQQIPETPTVSGGSPSSVSPGCSSGRPTFFRSSFMVGSVSETDGHSAADLLQKKKNTKPSQSLHPYMHASGMDTDWAIS